MQRKGDGGGGGADAGGEGRDKEGGVGSVPRRWEGPLQTQAVDVGGARRVLEDARRRECRRVGFASASAVYGSADRAGGSVREDDPQEPISPYAVQKLAAEHSKLEVGTGLAIAFARTPMTVANLAHDLQQFSVGRLWLGLGSQIKPHIEARYGMPWSKPVARMKEFVRALRAIFANWNANEKLDFRGEFYTHTLMPPLFNPGPSTGGPPPIYLGGGAHRSCACGERIAWFVELCFEAVGDLGGAAFECAGDSNPCSFDEARVHLVLRIALAMKREHGDAQHRAFGGEMVAGRADHRPAAPERLGETVHVWRVNLDSLRHRSRPPEEHHAVAAAGELTEGYRTVVIAEIRQDEILPPRVRLDCSPQIGARDVRAGSTRFYG